MWVGRGGGRARKHHGHVFFRIGRVVFRVVDHEFVVFVVVRFRSGRVDKLFEDFLQKLVRVAKRGGGGFGDLL